MRVDIAFFGHAQRTLLRDKRVLPAPVAIELCCRLSSSTGMCVGVQIPGEFSVMLVSAPPYGPGSAVASVAHMCLQVKGCLFGLHTDSAVFIPLSHSQYPDWC